MTKQFEHDLYDRDDSLAHCKVCGGAEGSLPTLCPGRRMTEQEERDVYAGRLDFTNGPMSGGAWWIPKPVWDEQTERQAFEDAAYAHYLRRREERDQRGQIGVLDNPAAPHPREMLFYRDERGEYVAIAYQQAWGGWRLARGGL